MELAKLHHHTNKAFKNRQRLKYYSLGIIPPTLILSNQTMTQQMIDMDSCLHQQNDKQVLNGDFPDYVPESQSSNPNKLYSYFIRSIKERQRQNQNIQSDKNNALMGGKRKREAETKVSRFKLKNNQQASQKWSTYPDQLAEKIYEEVQKKCSLKRFKLFKHQKQLKKLNQQMQSQFQKLEKYKNPDLDNHRVKTSMSINVNMNISTDISYPLKRFTIMEQIQKEIGQKKMEISNKKDQCSKLIGEERLLTQQKVNFLFLLLKNTHNVVFNKGVWWVLQKLGENQQQICQNDLYHQLDSISKNFLLGQYEKMRLDMSRRKDTYYHNNFQKDRNKDGDKDRDKKYRQQFNVLPSIGPSRLINIEKNDSCKKIYIESQNYIVDWVRNQRWKMRSLKHKPEESSYRKDWRGTQIKRLKDVYSKQKSSNLLNYMFGDRKSLYQMKFYENREEDQRKRKHVSQLKRNKSKSDMQERKHNRTVQRLKSMN